MGIKSLRTKYYFCVALTFYKVSSVLHLWPRQIRCLSSCFLFAFKSKFDLPSLTSVMK